MALESACIPIPSEVILPFGGYLVSQGELLFWGVVLAGTVGGTIGSVGAYLVGVHGGRPLLLRYGRYLLISPQHLEQAENWFARYGEATAFFTRLLPVVRTFISLPAGIARMPLDRFVIYTFLGSLPWSWLLTYVGVQLGNRWEQLGTLFHQLDLLIVILLVVLVCYLLWRHLVRHRA
ncbi:MAG: DedA family protein [Clostridia bacterium]|nr:MAG: DedA family protein [Clostridia bacterium]